MALRSSKRSLEAGDGSGAKEDPRPSGCLTSEEPTSLPSTGSTVSELNLNGSGAPLLCRVIAKSENRSWFVERNTKKVFTFRMVDGTGEVSVVAFDGLAGKFHETIQIGRCYRVSLHATTWEMGRRSRRFGPSPGTQQIKRIHHWKQERQGDTIFNTSTKYRYGIIL